ncbi:MAG: aromatic ring-hydroxylating dioxygenase subunit alpha [Gammaproteobacteria bacterium]|nr:aromatic ring-hydroxylating dioxygenase subunit alpha [Gammaproteobacteria bacterium]
MAISASDTPKQPPGFMEGATCLPARSYTSREQFDREIECCFRTGWISIATTQQLLSPGEILPVNAAGEPLIITRDSKNQVHVFYNICRHRGLKLVDGELPQKCSGLLSCPYHSWGYALDGRLMATPYFDSNKDSFPDNTIKEKSGLLPIRFAVWADIIFVNLSGKAQPFEEFIAPLQQRWHHFDLSLLRLAYSNRYTVSSNWKLACENFLDTYHVPWVHSRLGGPDEMFSGLEFTYLSDDIFGFIKPDFDRGRDQAEFVPTLFPGIETRFEYALDLVFIFPNTLLMITPSWLQLISLAPQGPALTHELLAGYLVGDAMMSDSLEEYRAGFAELLNEINTQDVVILEKLQAGRKTAAADHGQYAPYWDQLSERLAQRILRAVKA